jgi:hypothetical protein
MEITPHSEKVKGKYSSKYEIHRNIVDSLYLKLLQNFA